MNTLFSAEFWIVYMLPLSITIAVFYLIYRLFVQNDTHFMWRRFSILGCLIFAIILPFLNFEIAIISGMNAVRVENFRPLQQIIFELPIFTVYAVDSEVAVATSLPIFKIIGGIYLTIVSFLLIYGFVGVLRLMAFSRGGFENLNHHSQGIEALEMPEKRIVVSPKISTAFSFFTTIFMPETLYNNNEKEMILAHERVHVQQKHSWDLTLMNLICVIQFFNPFVWLLRREMCLNHEFLADKGALSNSEKTEQYFQLLLKKTIKNQLVLVHSFHHSPLKHRIMMQITKPAKMLSQARYLVFIPLALALTFSFACQGKSTLAEVEVLLAEKKELNLFILVDGEIFNGTMNSLDSVFSPHDIEKISILKDSASIALYGQSIEDCDGVIVVTTVKKITSSTVENLLETVERAKSSSDENTIFTIVEDAPDFPGGEEARMRYLRENVRYPAEAREKNIQGTVFVSFVVEKDGSITDVKVVRGIGGGADEEAVRVVENMPKWVPGKQDGKNVRVQFIMSLRFVLSGQQEE